MLCVCEFQSDVFEDVVYQVDCLLRRSLEKPRNVYQRVAHLGGFWLRGMHGDKAHRCVERIQVVLGDIEGIGACDFVGPLNASVHFFLFWVEFGFFLFEIYICQFFEYEIPLRLHAHASASIAFIHLTLKSVAFVGLNLESWFEVA